MPTPFPTDSFLHLLDLAEDADFMEVKHHIVDGLACFSTRNLDSIRKGALAKLIARSMSTASVVLSVHGWGVWPSGEIPELFERIRSSAGVKPGPNECAGDLISPEESDYLLCLVACCLFSCWDFSIVGSDGALMLYCTHDDEIYVSNTPLAWGVTLQQEVTDFGLPSL